jgi:hypothetical protein
MRFTVTSSRHPLEVHYVDDGVCRIRADVADKAIDEALAVFGREVAPPGSPVPAPIGFAPLVSSREPRSTCLRSSS